MRSGHCEKLCAAIKTPKPANLAAQEKRQLTFKRFSAKIHDWRRINWDESKYACPSLPKINFFGIFI